MSELGIVAAVAVGSYALRVSFVAVGHRRLPQTLERLLDQVKPAILTALGVTALVGHDEVGVAHLGAIAVAGVVARWRADLLTVLAVGMATLWIL